MSTTAHNIQLAAHYPNPPYLITIIQKARIQGKSKSILPSSYHTVVGTSSKQLLLLLRVGFVRIEAMIVVEFIHLLLWSSVRCHCVKQTVYIHSQNADGRGTPYQCRGTILARAVHVGRKKNLTLLSRVYRIPWRVGIIALKMGESVKI